MATLHLFPGERSALLDLLADLSPADWDAPTICTGWSVKDVAAHLLGDDIGRLSWGRDGYVNPAFTAGLDIEILPGLVAAIDRQNAVWVEGTRRVSPRLLIELLRMTGELTEANFQRLDLQALGMPVDWAGPEPAPVWFDVAREYTERWVHQQHIRDAVGRPGLKERQWLAPVLETFVRGMARPLAGVAAPEGTALRLTITGEAGGEWITLREAGGWQLGNDPAIAATATVELDQDVAWRLFTKGITKDEARQSAVITGDAALAERALDIVSILA
ncbi:MAG: maleylpyruvate isomerase family mycothiol-dependent enzyme [Chloroflexia bacterium]|nr:maleylpyruvate isomerase family mycothiol-dependent enzyme [Chloroflexia bacterium]